MTPSALSSAPLNGSRVPPADRRPARRSPREDVEAVGAIADLPTLILELPADLVGALEVAVAASLPSLLGEPDGFGRNVCRLREGSQPEQIECSLEQVVIAPPPWASTIFSFGWSSMTPCITRCAAVTVVSVGLPTVFQR